MKDEKWEIRRKGCAWRAGEAQKRYALTPGKLEMWQGRLLWTTADRVKLLGLLLENVGADRAVRVGSLEVWREAIAAPPLTVAIVGDSVITQTPEYESVLRKGVTVSTRAASVLSNGELKGNLTATGTEVVNGTTVSVKAPQSLPDG